MVFVEVIVLYFVWIVFKLFDVDFVKVVRFENEGRYDVGVWSSFYCDFDMVEYDVEY